jgi:dihydroorotate dehydrogenase (fumarate)
MNPIEFYDYKIREDNLNNYIQLIKDSKKNVSIPVIASINCCHNSAEWISYAKQIQDAGADALELNMFFLPSNFERSQEDTQKLYFQIIENVLHMISIPVSLKISYYFTDLGPMIQRLSGTGIKGLVLFNRFFSPDFDIDKFEVKPSFTFSSPSDLSLSLRWVAVMAQRVKCDLAASTGVHDSNAVIKQILAGASAVQIVSCLYKNGIGYIETLLKDLDVWMHNKGFKRVSDFKGKMSQNQSINPSLYERTQFMKYFGDKRFNT